MAIATIVATTLQGLVNPNNNQAPPPTPPPRGTKYYYESLRKNKAPTFDGSPDAEVAQTWRKNIETQLRLLEVPDAVKVDVITPLLDEPRLLRQPALEALTNSARTDSPRKTRPEQFPAKRRRAAAGGARRRRDGFGSGPTGPGPTDEYSFHLHHRDFTVTPIADQIGPIDSVSETEYYDLKNHFSEPQCKMTVLPLNSGKPRDTASRGPTTIAAPESQFRTCPTDHGKASSNITP
ncbi:hypothetical protein F511_30604 [Dorcoceras hygrometricum]|uniref:Uncharacterized protein n=1 Tax=Dorcoceras hygrometricum TaxID=472368 RepID=A0A2Z7BYA8_9LAMI|nr:hypothetical protein F511_30604 [Dorcoceras hygrometricum]